MNYGRTFSILIILLAIGCNRPERENRSYVALIGATIIDGNGGDPVPQGILLINEGRIVAIGTKEQVKLPEHTTILNTSGKTIIPGIINAHGHVGETKGIEGNHYSQQNVIDNLSIYARYGVTSVVSLGGDKKEAEAIRAIHDTTSNQHARLFIAGDVINGNTPEEAIAVVNRNDQIGVDWMKIRVDDNLGTSLKMPENIYKAVINKSHQLGYKIATHMYYLDDARKLLQAGTDMLAHSIRDQEVDDSFVTLLKEKKVPYCATLTRELSTFVYGDTAEFFKDPFFIREYDSITIDPLNDPARQLQIKNSQSAKTYKQQLPVAMANLKTLMTQGIPIVFGTDSGVPTRFMGYFEHLEMTMMAEAGLTPMQIIVSASKTAAEFMGLKDLGTLSPGHWADFIILDADPLMDIKNVRQINKVFIGGVEVTR